MGHFSRKCAKSINQSSVEFHCNPSLSLWLDWLIGFVPPELCLRGRGQSDSTYRDNTVTKNQSQMPSQNKTKNRLEARSDTARDKFDRVKDQASGRGCRRRSEGMISNKKVTLFGVPVEVVIPRVGQISSGFAALFLRTWLIFRMGFDRRWFSVSLLCFLSAFACLTKCKGGAEKRHGDAEMRVTLQKQRPEVGRAPARWAAHREETELEIRLT